MSERTHSRAGPADNDGSDANAPHSDSARNSNSSSNYSEHEPPSSTPPPRPFPGSIYNIEHFVAIGIVAINFLMLVSFLIMFIGRNRSSKSSSYYFALFFSAMSNLIVLVFQFLQEKNELPNRILHFQDFQILLFDIVFWFGYPTVFMALIIPAVHGIFQIIDCLPVIASYFNIHIPNELSNALGSTSNNRHLILNYLSLTEPIWLVLLLLAVFWNGIYSLLLYYLWINYRLRYSENTKFSINWWNSFLDNNVQHIHFITPYYSVAKNVISKANLSNYLH